MSSKIFIVTILICLQLSCNPSKEQTVSKNCGFIETDNNDKMDDTLYNFLGIENPRNTYDSLYYSFRFKSNYSVLQEIIVITYCKKLWKIKAVTYSAKFDYEKNLTRYDLIFNKSLLPKIDMSSFPKEVDSVMKNFNFVYKANQGHTITEIINFINLTGKKEWKLSISDAECNLIRIKLSKLLDEYFDNKFIMLFRQDSDDLTRDELNILEQYRQE